MNEDFNEQCLQENPTIEQPMELVYTARKPSGFIPNEIAVRLATKLIKLSEGCELKAYPDPASDLYRALSIHGLLAAYKQGTLALPEGFEKLSGAPWTCGWGETEGVSKNTVWTQQEADNRLDKRIRGFMQAIYKVTPNLFSESPEKQAAITSLVYNIGVENYKKYAISKLVAAGDHLGVSNKFKQYVMANGLVSHGLQVRREREANLYMSVMN